MSDSLRRIYNTVDVIFDSRAIVQETRSTRPGGGSNLPGTALQAFNRVLPHVLKLDRQARLKLIVSQQGAGLAGTSSHWEFFFDLVQRRAQLSADWILPWDEAIDGYGPAEVQIVVKPFPPVDSLLRQAVKEGKLLHKQLISMWGQECKRRPNLPHKFRDTDIVLADLSKQGLDTSQTEFSLRTGVSPKGQVSWIAETRNTTYYSPFA